MRAGSIETDEGSVATATTNGTFFISTSAVVDGTGPFTFGGWVYFPSGELPHDISTHACPICISDTGSGSIDRIKIRLFDDTTSTRVAFVITENNNSSFIESTGSLSADTWHFVAASFDAGSIAVWIDTTKESSSEADRNPTGLNATTVGGERFGNNDYDVGGGYFGPWAGWDVVPTDQELRSMANGKSLFQIQPDQLNYLSMMDDDVPLDLTGNAGTFSVRGTGGTPAQTNVMPPIFLPRPQQIFIPSAVGVSGSPLSGPFGGPFI